MKKQIILASAAFVLASYASAQTVINVAGNSRFQTPYTFGSTYTGISDIDYSLAANVLMNTWNSNTFAAGGDAGDSSYSFKWGQVLQFNVTAASDQTAFNNATEFEISLSNAPSQSFSLYASTVQLKDVSPGAGSDFLAGESSGSGAANTWFQDQVPGETGGPMAFLGSYSGGSASITGSASLNSLLSGTTFDSSTSYVYLVAVANTDGAFEGPNWGSSSVTAVPEPSTYALLAGCLALASVMVRRRR